MRRELIESYYEEYQRELERFLESDPEMFSLEAEIHYYIEILEVVKEVLIKCKLLAPGGG